MYIKYLPEVVIWECEFSFLILLDEVSSLFSVMSDIFLNCIVLYLFK